MKILIADDSKLVRSVVKNVLLKNGITEDRILMASDGAEAEKIIQEQLIELLLIDWMMPNLNGLDLVRKLKLHSHYAQIPIIMMTVVDDYSKVQEALNSGVDEYILKPINEDVLWNRIDSQLKKTTFIHFDNIKIIQDEYNKSGNKDNYLNKWVHKLFVNREHYIFAMNMFQEYFKDQIEDKSLEFKDINELMKLLETKLSRKDSLKTMLKELLEKL